MNNRERIFLFLCIFSLSVISYGSELNSLHGINFIKSNLSFTESPEITSSPSEGTEHNDNEESSSSSSNEEIKTAEQLLASIGADLIVIPVFKIYYLCKQIVKLIDAEKSDKEKMFIIDTCFLPFVMSPVSLKKILDESSSMKLVQFDKTVNPDTLYQEYANAFLLEENSDVIKSFLKNDLSARNQIELFQRTCNHHYLNSKVAHSLIKHGATFSILENFKQLLFPEYTANDYYPIEIEPIKIHNDQQAALYKKSLLIESAEKKFLNLIHFYNKAMQQKAVDFYYKDEELSKKYTAMIFNYNDKTLEHILTCNHFNKDNLNKIIETKSFATQNF